jgi:hypothetical protein
MLNKNSVRLNLEKYQPDKELEQESLQEQRFQLVESLMQELQKFVELSSNTLRHKVLKETGLW